MRRVGLSRRSALRAAALVAAAGAFGALRQARADTGTLKIGVLLPLSGYLASSGSGCLQGVRLAEQLLPQMRLPPFVVLTGDTEESAESALAATERLIAAGVHVLIGCYDSGQTLAAAALAERHRIPFIVNIAAAPSITEQGYRFVFRNFPDARQIVLDSYALQKQLFRRTGFAPKRVVVLHINNGRGVDLIWELYPHMDMPYAMSSAIAYDPKAEDLSAEVAAARATGADAVWTVSRADDAIRLTREMVRQVWTPSVLMSSNAGLHEPSYRSALGAAADYAITFAPYYDPRKRLARRVIELQTRLEPGVPLGTLQAYSFEAVLIALDAYRRCGSRDAERLAAALRRTHLKDTLTPGAAVAFDAAGQNRNLTLFALQNIAGRGLIVLPGACAEAHPVLPMPPWSQRG